MKDSFCSNTLNTIVFYQIDFWRISLFGEVFEKSNSLESVHILNCISLNSNFIQQIINVKKPFKLDMFN